jgi:hypothetical protein
LSRVQSEFKRQFPADELKGDADALRSWEEVCDSFPSNHTLHAELEANAKYDTSDEHMTDALHNYGFAYSTTPVYDFDEQVSGVAVADGHRPCSIARVL